MPAPARGSPSRPARCRSRWLLSASPSAAPSLDDDELLGVGAERGETLSLPAQVGVRAKADLVLLRSPQTDHAVDEAQKQREARRVHEVELRKLEHGFLGAACTDGLIEGVEH